MTFAQAVFISVHLSNGRPDLALIVMRMPAPIFAEMDAMLEAAWLAGAADAARKG